MQPGSKPLGQAVEQGNRRFELAPLGGGVLVGQRCDHGVDDSVFPAYKQFPAGAGDRHSHAAAVFLAAGSLHQRPSFQLADHTGDRLGGDALPRREPGRRGGALALQADEDAQFDEARCALPFGCVQLPQSACDPADRDPQVLRGEELLS